MSGRKAEKNSMGDGGYYPPPPFPFAFHLLEVTVVSAQELYPASRAMRTYAVAYVDGQQYQKGPARTRVDAAGHTDPTWNDKFVFRVGDAALRSDTAAVTVDVYARLLFRDSLIGTARGLLSTLRPAFAPRFVALQVRRPGSLRPQGILNLGVALLDGHARSIPLHARLSSPPPKRWKQTPEAGEEEMGKDRRMRAKSFGAMACFAPVMDSGEMAAARPRVGDAMEFHRR